MNPPNPFFHPSFTFLPQIPNPNPSPNTNFSYSIPPNPHTLVPIISSDTISDPPSNLDLQGTVSVIKDLINLAESTVKAVSDLLYSGKPPEFDDDFCSCPFDSRHRMAPEFLFRHSLRCSSSPAVVDLELLESLHYPSSLKTEDELRRENRFVQSLEEPDSELCFSLDDYGDFGTNFFYRDCPGVVSSSEQDAAKKTFTLPCVLSLECANFISNTYGEVMDLPRDYLTILPSELWALKNELELWNDYPSSYSYNVLRVASCLRMIKEADMLTWVISNSPLYGIVIDVYMRDHIFLLLKLCLKAISREAFRSSGLLLREASKEGNGELNPKTLSFECPILVEVLKWLASQLSVLYGEANGKFFSINMLKHSLLNAASGLLLFPLGQRQAVAIDSKAEDHGNSDESVSDLGSEFVRLETTGGVKLEEPSNSRKHGGGSLFSDENAGISQVFVSQVAAAIAALQERSLLEEKVRGLRYAGPISKSHLMVEYTNLSMRADEERHKRLNYRPIIEHDGLLLQPSQNQETSKARTREELLAEERDYKRRRMSYRGKKVKRTKIQVMRDIIEEHMEKIKQAGGIGCFVKGASEGGRFLSGMVSDKVMTTDVSELNNSAYDSIEACPGPSHSHGKESRSDHSMAHARSDDARSKDREGFRVIHDSRNPHHQQRHESDDHHESLENHQRCIGRDRREKDNIKGRRGRDYSEDRRERDCSKDRRERDYSKDRREKGYSKVGRDKDYSSRNSESYRSQGRSYEQSRRQKERDDVDVTETKYDRSHRVCSHRSNYHDNTSFSSSIPESDVSEEKHQMPEIKNRWRERVYKSRKTETVTQDMFEDRYDPSRSYDKDEEAYDDSSCSSRFVRPEYD
ncbi:PREDICTED: U11/U12 small nuclear ribonucleoprotein 48 kDa protein [Nelumbo nucifera]|uniref:U11/U12 small nuclear ribonucleoprotein 48 kDa protein n=1 Tax=Nelumbo nucifera TaxID=4432 RepID=A0A1U7Z2S9_NELNU|nr:PREDICTED: U11/U12 small nuclear ribonucleoprotein 48 kDa protein [Nelumbo nucifera]XP_010247448.1 PREDICTED: U11/U12 small nuclear ribonucleoprotein 48 kDa protein [Nelumbo nucifera]